MRDETWRELFEDEPIDESESHCPICGEQIPVDADHGVPNESAHQCNERTLSKIDKMEEKAQWSTW